MSLRRPKRDPGPLVRAALQRQHWLSAEQVALAAELRVSVVRACLREWAAAGEIDCLPGDKGKKLYRKRR